MPGKKIKSNPAFKKGLMHINIICLHITTEYFKHSKRVEEKEVNTENDYKTLKIGVLDQLFGNYIIYTSERFV